MLDQELCWARPTAIPIENPVNPPIIISFFIGSEPDGRVYSRRFASGYAGRLKRQIAFIWKELRGKRFFPLSNRQDRPEHFARRSSRQLESLCPSRNSGVCPTVAPRPGA